MYPSLAEARAIAASGPYRRIPVSMELFSDGFTPIEVLRTIRAESSHCFLLESAEDAKQWGRYTFLGYGPTLELTCSGGMLRLKYDPESGNPRTEERAVDHPGDALREIIRYYQSPIIPGLPPFTGGLVGYFSFEYLQYAEPSLRATAPTGGDFLDADLMLFDRLVVFDNYRQRLILIVGADTGDLDRGYAEAEKALRDMAVLLRSGKKHVFPPLHLASPLELCFSEQRFTDMVNTAKHYIHEGDIFQVVLSNPMEASVEGSLLDVYRVLRTTNPSPYMFYFNSDDIEVAGASPETLVKLVDGTLHTFPLAGTRPRGATAEEDKALARELLNDRKELAEHNMLVDLGRNDLGKISRLGTVQVEKYLSIERFSHVMHIGSTVSGTIREDRDAVDAIDAILPAGTLSGAPKLRACEIIQELEGRPRGVYGGAVGYLDLTGNLDVCISIRLAYKKNGRICVQSGAGIVADSVPENEYLECRNKAMAVISAIETAEGGIL